MASVMDEIQARQQIITAAADARTTEQDFADRLKRFSELLDLGQLTTAAPLLPLLYNIRGQPMNLDSHAPMEELFSFQVPRWMTIQAGRQTSKSTLALAVKSVTMAASIPYHTILCITPLFEQIRRFSTNYVSPLINESPVRQLWSGTKTVDSVLHKTFKNGSQLIFSYCFLDCSRIRGISSKQLTLDEVQNLNYEHLAVIRECMSFFPQWGLEMRAGTPLTKDGILTAMYEEGSMAEWFIPCLHCTENGHPTWNIPSVEFHADKMIGPCHDNISERYPGTICRRCGKAISPRMGHWVHRYQEKQWTHASYHLPQIIFPFHYAYPTKWKDLWDKRQGKNNTTVANFYNEVMGEACDESAKLVSQDDIQRVARLGPCRPEEALKRMGHYKISALGVDWGGGGEGGISFTTLALAGMNNDGTIEVPWGIRLLTPHDHIREATDVLAFWQYFSPTILAHDYTGAGSLRETFAVQAGIPVNRLMPCMYVRSASGAPCRPVLATPKHPRNHYRVDKTRTLLLTCSMIRLGRLTFFDYDHHGKDDAGLLHDFLALIEEKTQTNSAGEIYRISRAKGYTDDFAQAVNFGCVALWNATKRWPNFLSSIPSGMTRDQEEAAGPEDPQWD